MSYSLVRCRDEVLDQMSLYGSPGAFEHEVRRVASALWPRAIANGPVILNGRERDGVFDDGDVIHIVEATLLQTLEKTKKDLEKSVDLVRSLRRVDAAKSYKIWLITGKDPTAHQVGEAENGRKKARCPVEIISFRKFSARLIDSAQYLHLRLNYQFGSVRNPADEKDFEVPIKDYVPLDILRRGSDEIINPNDLINIFLATGKGNIVILGDYGSGKSMTLRSLFYELRNRHLNSSILRFPVYINLRDHFGQSDPSEALMRHATRIGMADPHQLIAAWRAGFVLLILDGFDEVSSARLVRGTEKVKRARREAVRLIRTFISESPARSRVLLSGREHYFDSGSEMFSALGLKNDDVVYTLNEFSSDQIDVYLRKHGINDFVPDWLPSRPLLLGYLVVRGLLTPDESGQLPQAADQGWDYILDRVCEREAQQIDPVLIDSSAVRELIERLATKARNTASGRGPIFLKEIGEVFEAIFDMPPDEKSEVLILRLPGLTASSGEGTREFIDDDFVDAARVGDVLRFVENPFVERGTDLESCASPMGSLGTRVAASKLIRIGATAKKLNSALAEANKRNLSSFLILDLINIMKECGFNLQIGPIFLRDEFIGYFDVHEMLFLGDVVFQECYFGILDFEAGVSAAVAPKFEKCVIEEIVGPVSMADVADGIFDKSTEIIKIREEAKTNSDILSLEIAMSIRVLMTILRKLFFQAGSGSREGAFFRGLDHKGRAYVPEILNLLQTHNFAHPQRLGGPPIWLPNRAKSSVAGNILAAPQQNKESLLRAVKRL